MLPHSRCLLDKKNLENSHSTLQLRKNYLYILGASLQPHTASKPGCVLVGWTKNGTDSELTQINKSLVNYKTTPTF